MIVVVGGHTRNIGKTSLLCGLVAATADLNWTAIKITQYGHGACSEIGEECGCHPSEPAHAYALDAQLQADGTDSGRYLTAGARRSYWLRTAEGCLAEGMPALRDVLATSVHTIIESNSIMGLLVPDLYLVVADEANSDWKRSARIHWPRADAVIPTSDGHLPPLDRWVELLLQSAAKLAVTVRP